MSSEDLDKTVLAGSDAAAAGDDVEVDPDATTLAEPPAEDDPDATVLAEPPAAADPDATVLATPPPKSPIRTRTRMPRSLLTLRQRA